MAYLFVFFCAILHSHFRALFLALYWLKCTMPMLVTDVEPIFHQRWLNRNKKKGIFGKLDINK